MQPVMALKARLVNYVCVDVVVSNSFFIVAIVCQSSAAISISGDLINLSKSLNNFDYSLMLDLVTDVLTDTLFSAFFVRLAELAEFLTFPVAVFIRKQFRLLDVSYLLKFLPKNIFGFLVIVSSKPSKISRRH